MVLAFEDTLVFEELSVEGYKKVLKISEKTSGLSAIICLHNTLLGPALGGTRIYPYTSFDEALVDVMRLAKGMTYKSALAETGFGGGKSVIIASQHQKTPALLRAFGQAVNRLKGEYICAEDVGSTPADMSIIQKETPYVVGLEHQKSSGDPAPFTAWGTYRGIQSALQKLYGDDSVQNRVIAIQGLGNVGEKLAHYLFWNGAKLIVTDIDTKKVEKLAKLYGATPCSPEAILDVKCDIFAPCAMGAVINPSSLSRLKCKAVAGAANNQLLSDEDAEQLRKLGILYAPDFIINSGGLINVVHELKEEGYHPCNARLKIHEDIYNKLMLIYEISDKKQISTQAAAIALGDQHLAQGIGKRTSPPHFHHAE